LVNCDSHVRFSGCATLRARGDQLILGIRPEDLYEASPRPGDGRIVPLQATVVAVEPLGAETILVLARDGVADEFIAPSGRQTGLRSGASTTIMLDTAALHLFDATTTRAIARPGT
jgi:multiple sugar transport system ATP-binding protein